MANKKPTSSYPDTVELKPALFRQDVMTPLRPVNTIIDLFDYQVGQHADKVAVQDWAIRETATYGQLADRVNQFTNAILESLNGTRTNIAVEVNTPIETIAAFLGVLRAGSTYLPFDTSNPPARNRQLIEHGQVGLLVNASVVTSDDIHSIPAHAVDSAPTEVAALAIDPESIARIMYTSGSTGRPKGVIQTHRYLAERIRLDFAFYGFGPDDKLASLLPLSFTAATSQFHGALLSGATLSVYNPKQIGIHRFADWLSEERITGLKAIPTLFRRGLQNLDSERVFPNLRYVVCGGEALIPKDVELFRKHLVSPALLINQYALSECEATARFVIETSGEPIAGIVPVGTPVEEKRIRMVDKTGAEVAKGEIGEMEVESRNLSTGYWNDPETHAQAFSQGPEWRTFLTGDLGRIRADGNLELRGRADSRVKIRGNGVDLLEVHEALIQHPGITEAVVKVVEGASGDSELAGYFVGLSESGRSELRRSMTEKLPEFAIPQHLIPLSELPLTPRGKIDRSALPAPSMKPENREIVAPATERETVLLAIWREVLSTEEIGVTEDFFSLEGSSMQALELFAAIDKTLGIDAPPTLLFSAPTIRGLAQALSESHERRSLIPVRREGDRSPLYIVHGGGGGVFFAADIARHLDASWPVYAFQAAGFDGAPSGRRTVEEIASGYLAELLAYQPEGPYLLAGLSFGGLIAQEMARRLQQDGHEVQLLIMIDTKFPGDRLPPAPDRHREKMANMSVAARGRYIAAGAWRRGVRRPIRKMVANRYMAAGKQLPDWWNIRRNHFWRIHVLAARDYAPRDLNAPLLIIAEQGATQRHRETWGAVSEGPVTIREMDTGHHSLSREPAVGELTRLMEHELRKLIETGSGLDR